MFSIRTEIDVKDCGEGNTRPGTQHIQSAGVLWEPSSEYLMHRIHQGAGKTGG